MAKKCAFLVVIFGLILAIRPATAAPENPKITLGHIFGTAATVYYIAQDQHFFEKHGLDPKLIVMNEGSTIVSSLASGSIQFGTPTPSVLLQAVDSGLDMVVVAGTYQYPTPTQVGLLGRSDETIKTPQDLVGKKVGVAGFGGLQHMVAKKWLLDNGVDPAKVTFIETPFARMGDALKAHQLDAVTADGPIYDRITNEKLAYQVVDFQKVIPDGTVGGVISAERDWAAKNPQTIAAFRATLHDAVDFAKANPAQTKQIIGKAMNMPADVTASLEIPNLLVEVKPEQLKFWDDLLRGQKLITKKFTLDSLIVP